MVPFFASFHSALKIVTISSIYAELVKPHFIISQLPVVFVVTAAVAVLVMMDYKLEAKVVDAADHLEFIFLIIQTSYLKM